MGYLNPIRIRRLKRRCKPTFYGVAVIGILGLLNGCGVPPPPCVVGNKVPSTKLKALLKSVPNTTSLDLAIDGSGSMLGLTASGQPAKTWKKLVHAVTLSAASTGVKVKTLRVGSGSAKEIKSWQEAMTPCFFQGCGGFRPVTSSLDSLWRKPGLVPSAAGKPPKVPLRLEITDLEVDNGDITKLIASIKPHVEQGAVIGILALKMPFDGAVYNSEGQVIHRGKAQRPIYMLATGPQHQVHNLLNQIQSNAAKSGIKLNSMKLTYLAKHVSLPTLEIKKTDGVPPGSITKGLPIHLQGKKYGYSDGDGYAFVKRYPDAQGVLLGTKDGVNLSLVNQPALGIVKLQGIDLFPLHGEVVKGVAIKGDNLIVQIDIPKDSPGNAIRAVVPRGEMPQQWWVDWDRRDPKSPQSKEQTDGLLLLLTSLAKMHVEAEPGSTPAVSLCLMYSK